MRILFLILIFTRPFICSLVYPGLNAIHSCLLLIILGLYLLDKKRKTPDLARWQYPLIIFSTAILFSLAFSQDKSASLSELYKYACGMLLFVAATTLAEKERTNAIRALVAAGVCVSLWVIYQYFIGFKHVEEYMAQDHIVSAFATDYLARKRVFLPFITSNALGGYLAMLIPLTLTEKKITWCILPLALALFCTKSLGAPLSLFLAMAVYFYIMGWPNKKIVIPLLGLALLITAVFMARFTVQKEDLQPAFSTVMRVFYWQDTLAVIKAHPWIGVGIGNFKLGISRYAHNSYLQLWAEMGSMGIISFLIFLSAAWPLRSKRPYSRANAALAAAALVFIIHNLVDFTFFLPEVAFLWWSLLGLRYAASPKAPNTPSA